MDKPQYMPSVPPGVTVRVVDVGALAAEQTLRLVRESDENATDGDLDERMSYRLRWHAYLGGGAA